MFFSSISLVFLSSILLLMSFISIKIGKLGHLLSFEISCFLLFHSFPLLVTMDFLLEGLNSSIN